MHDHESARDFYEEAKRANALPSLPLVCFRDDNTGPFFQMIGDSAQIADAIKAKSATMSGAEQKEAFRASDAFRKSDYLYVAPFNHGIAEEGAIFDRKDPNDASRAEWILAKEQLEREFNVNWGTLRFREKTTQAGKILVIHYGRCEWVSK